MLRVEAGANGHETHPLRFASHQVHRRDRSSAEQGELFRNPDNELKCHRWRSKPPDTSRPTELLLLKFDDKMQPSLVQTTGYHLTVHYWMWRFLIRSLQHYTDSWLSRYHEQSLELRLLEPLSFGQRWRSRACIFQEFGWTSSMLRDVLVVLLWPAWCSHLSSPMQMRDAMQLQKKWRKRGNLPCRHPHVQHEYYYDTPTGAMVCTTCGSTVTFKDVEKSRRIEAVSR